MQIQKPKQLKKGDTLAIVSPSWGGPGTFPHIYENGKKVLQNLGFKIKEFPLTKTSASYNYLHPELRAKDINDAFKDPEVNGIITSIGGEDSIRILPYLDLDIIKENFKFFMGFSDTTSIHSFLSINGLTSFYGPSVMAGFSQYEALGEKFQNHLEAFLFSDFDLFKYESFDFFSNGYPNWALPENSEKINDIKTNDAWNFLQGKGSSEGELFGGCIETMTFLNGTKYWPSEDFWKNKIFFIETAEEKPDLTFIKRILRNFGIQGVFQNIKALIIGRSREYNISEREKFEQSLLKFFHEEFDLYDLPIVSNMDFGHTVPQFVLPLGGKAELNCENKTFSLIESPYSKIS